MPRKSKQVAPRADARDNLEMDEMDQFDHDQDEILLEQAGINGRRPQSEDEMSDEEVMALSDEEEDFDEMDEEEEEGDEEDEEEGWGNSRANYYGADEVEDDEQAELEEQEARRLQRKQLSEMTDADYFDEDEVEGWKQAAKATDEADEEQEVEVHDASRLDNSERLSMLKLKYPELIPLAKELITLQGVAKSLDQESEAGRVQFTALTNYLGTINAYFALFITGIYNGAVSLKSHPVMEGIVKAREVWRQAHDLEDGDDVDDEEVELDTAPAVKKRTAVEADISDSDEEEFAIPEFSDDSEAEEQESSGAQEEESDDEFAVPLIQVEKKAKKPRSMNDFTEEDPHEVDREEKEMRKRSIRFYTSKIDQVSRKSGHSFGGDEDLPYKERHFERQKRLLEEARQRGIKTGSRDEELGGSESEGENDHGGNAEEDQFYNSAKAASKKKKHEKKTSHELAVKAAKEGKLAELRESEELGESGKRALNFQILKNKGLTPKRAKENRNSRVKKRKRYETAQKKLASTRRVYKQPTSAYGGEQTGIKKNLTRSVRFA